MKKIKNKVLSVLAFLFLLAIPLANYAQEDESIWSDDPAVTSEELKTAVDWAQGGSIVEDWFMKSFLKEYKDLIWGEFDTFIDVAIGLAAIFLIVFFGIRSYGMMTGDQKWEIMPLLRPFGLLLIILNWHSFCEMVSFPTDLMSNKMSEKNEAQQEKVNNLRFVRYQYQKKTADALYTLAAQAHIAENEGEKVDEDVLDKIGGWFKEGWDSLWTPVVAMKLRLQVSIQVMLTLLIETICLYILRICVYTAFSIQIIYSGIMIMLGPVSVAASILPIFRDSFSTWLSRFISINLYLTIALMVLFVGGIFMQFALETEIERYAELITSTGELAENGESKLNLFSQNGLFSFGMVIVTFIMTGICMMTVPSISTWIVNSSGASSAVSTAGRAAAVMAARGSRVGRILGIK